MLIQRFIKPIYIYNPMLIVRSEEERALIITVIGISIGTIAALLYVITFPSIYPLFLIIPSIVIPVIFNHFAYTRGEADAINMNRSR